MINYQSILISESELKLKIESIQEQLNILPEGSLLSTKNGAYQKWYQHKAGKLLYLKKKDRPLAESLALKKYLVSLQLDLSNELKSIQSYIHYHDAYQSKTASLLSASSPYKDLLDTHFRNYPDQVTNWCNTPYEKSNKFPNQLIHKTISGNIVRSKSESLIDSALFLNKLPFRYECALNLNDATYFPDFTIMHPRTGKIYYWEHFGRMDDLSYASKAFSKLNIYNMNQISLTHNLITTYEDLAHPLTSDYIEKIIHHYFLG